MQLIESSRLILRELETADAAFIVELVNSPGWLQYIGDRNIHDLEGGGQYIHKNVQNYTTQGFGLYAMQLKDTFELVGLCGLLKREYLPAADIGYALLPAFEGRGLAVEAAKAVMEYAQEQLQMKTLFAIVTPKNKRSIALLLKLGFALEKEIIEGGEPLMVYRWDQPDAQ